MPKSKRGKVKFYAVAIGRKPGVYSSWGECQKQTNGYSNAKFKSFHTPEEANLFIAQYGLCGGDSSSIIRSSPSSALDAGKPRSTTTTTIPAQSSRSISAASSSSTPAILNNTNVRHTTVACDPPGNGRTVPFQESPHPTDDLSIVVHFDGGARGNPGLGGAGAEVIASRDTSSSSSTRTQTTTDSREKKESNQRGVPSMNSESWKRTTRIRQYCGSRTTNNFAEYTGLLCGLKQAKLEVEEFISKSSPPSDKMKGSADRGRTSIDIRIRGDSNLIIQQLDGAYACKSPNIRPLFLKAQGLIEEIKRIANADGTGSTSRRGNDNSNREGNNVTVTITYQHVYREHNAVADALANEAMDKRKSWTTTFVDTYDDNGAVTVDDGVKTEERNESSQYEGGGNLIDV